MRKEKREVNAELIDVWAIMMREKMDDLHKRCLNEENDLKLAYLNGILSGMADSAAMLASLEDGR